MANRKLRQGQLLLAHLEGTPTTVRLVELWNPSPWHPRGALYVERPDHSDRRIISVALVDLACEHPDDCLAGPRCPHCRQRRDGEHLLGCPHHPGTAQPVDVCDQCPFDTGDLDPVRDRFELTIDIHAADPLPVAAAALRVLSRHGLTETCSAAIHTAADHRGRRYFAGSVDEHGECFNALTPVRRDLFQPPASPTESLETGGGRTMDGDELDLTCDRFEMAVELLAPADGPAYGSEILAALRRQGFHMAPTAPVWTKPTDGPGQYAGLAEADPEPRDDADC